jgi:hypothetical protein
VSITVDFQEGMTLRDLVLNAGGLSPAADLNIEVARLADPTRRETRQIAEIVHLQADLSFFVSEQDRRRYMGPTRPAAGTAADFVLQPCDRVTVRPLADFELQRSVTVTGEVRSAASKTGRTCRSDSSLHIPARG